MAMARPNTVTCLLCWLFLVCLSTKATLQWNALPGRCSNTGDVPTQMELSLGACGGLCVPAPGWARVLHAFPEVRHWTDTQLDSPARRRPLRGHGVRLGSQGGQGPVPVQGRGAGGPPLTPLSSVFQGKCRGSKRHRATLDSQYPRMETALRHPPPGGRRLGNRDAGAVLTACPSEGIRGFCSWVLLQLAAGEEGAISGQWTCSAWALLVLGHLLLTLLGLTESKLTKGTSHGVCTQAGSAAG